MARRNPREYHLRVPEPLVTPLPRNMLDAIADAGVDLADTAREAHVDPSALESGMTYAEVGRFIAVAWRRLDDPAFGLRAGCVLRPERYGISGLTAMASPTFGAALQRKARYNRLVWGDSYRIRRDAHEFTVFTEAPDESKPWSYSRVDMEFASLVTFGRRFASPHIAPLKAGFRRPEPSFRALYEEVFRCPVAFAQPANSLGFRRPTRSSRSSRPTRAPRSGSSSAPGRHSNSWTTAASRRACVPSWSARCKATSRRWPRWLRNCA